MNSSSIGAAGVALVVAGHALAAGSSTKAVHPGHHAKSSGVPVAASKVHVAAPAVAAPTVARRPTGAPGTSHVDNPEEITVSKGRVIGGGLMKRQKAPENISSITSAAIAQKMSVASPLQLVSTMPGANFGTSDAYGLSIRNFMSVRGLDQTEMGFSVEGIPGTDMMSYFPYTETYADNENISDITITPGNSRLQDPIISASGGEFIESVRNPGDRLAGHMTYSAGSYRGQRIFGRLDTGYIGHTGIKAFASYSYSAADNYIGSGRNQRQHVDLKLYKDWAPNSWSSLFLSYTGWTNSRIAPISLANWEKANRAGDGFSAYTYSGTFKPGVTSDYWPGYVYNRNAILMSLQNSFQLTNKLTFHITPYFRYTVYNGGGQTALNPASIYSGNQRVTPSYDSSYLQPNGKLFGDTVNPVTQYQTGVNAYLEYDVTHSNHLMFGYWHDNWNTISFAKVALMNQSGLTESIQGKYPLRDTNGQIISGTHYQIATDTNQFFVGDTQSFFHNKLQISAGFKELMYYASGTNQAPGTQYKFSAAISQPMPRFSISYDINHQMQVYANATTNARMPVTSSTYVNTYNLGTGGYSQYGNTKTKPEYTIGEQLGFRYYGLFNADLALFNMNLTNHQVSSLQIINGSLVGQSISAGGESIQGISAEVSTQRYHGLALYANGQYLHTRMGNDIAVGGDLLPTKGKSMVESPKYMTNIGLSYVKGPFFSNLSFKWVDSQYSTFMNDESMPAYKTVDIALGYRLPSYRFLKSPTIRLNFNNLSNVKYLGSLASVTTNAYSVKGVHGTPISGSKPTYYMSAPFAAMMTFSVDL
ncbi:TonB-dependent receptor [Ameyamaea chiangmaiensis]|uniref:TonB-dependent receptor n=1 Tax=Ameyamaea chiangmaiensis TaxID=442969 RepID=A0A850PDA1_9PROT|nr:TonB-dependent receptor [Ameyamaea chiangmaiensis]MBS4073924.1 TonB-dependent receptor [Ameyamaea chiangmaiensis]NVN39922.1 TonB-dependent receptor [Ameyamaea chiangmaiensis]